MVRTIFSVFAAILSLSAIAQEIRYVDDDAAPGGDGRSWGTAYQFLQDPLLQEPQATMTVRVAGGTYRPDETTDNQIPLGDRFASFTLRERMILEGGYRGLAGGGDPDDRDPKVFVTVLSGEIGNLATIEDNSLHVVTNLALPSWENPILEGFHVRNGNANIGTGSPTCCGGGYYSEGNNVLLQSCVFQTNRAVLGGGCYIRNPWRNVLTDCEFVENVASDGGGGLRVVAGSIDITRCHFRGNEAEYGGGAVFLSGAPITSDCTFFDNRAADKGGGVFAQWLNDNYEFRNHVIQGNQAGEDGGGAYFNYCRGRNSFVSLILNLSINSNSAGRGGGLFVEYCQPIKNSTFAGNRANEGGGVFVIASSILQSVLEGNSAISLGGGAVLADLGRASGCKLVRNESGGDGGGIALTTGEDVESCLVLFNSAKERGAGVFSAGYARLELVTVVNNDAGDRGGGYYAIDRAQSRRSIFWGNRASGAPQVGGNARLRSCCIEGGYKGRDNIGDDPHFVSPETGDFHLSAGSPCIDSTAGPDAAYSRFTVDGDGFPRFVDDPAIPDFKRGRLPPPDMGAFEFGAADFCGKVFEFELKCKSSKFDVRCPTLLPEGTRVALWAAGEYYSMKVDAAGYARARWPHEQNNRTYLEIHGCPDSYRDFKCEP